MPHAEGDLQTVIVLIVARNTVEEFLGKLEGQGYIADRLEMPRLDLLRATTVNQDGAWIYPDPASAAPTALVAWWYGGVLQSLALITLAPTNRPASLKEQLLQMAWAGELEGWVTGPPTWHLVADPQVAAEWEPDLPRGLEQPVEVIGSADSVAALAAMTAHARGAERAASQPAARRILHPLPAAIRGRPLDARPGQRVHSTSSACMIYFAWLQFARMADQQRGAGSGKPRADLHQCPPAQGALRRAQRPSRT